MVRRQRHEAFKTIVCLPRKTVCVWGSVGFHESFVEIHAYQSSAMSGSNLESNLQRMMNLPCLRI